MLQGGGSPSQSIQRILKEPPAGGRWGKGRGSSRNLAGNGLSPSHSGCFLRSLGMKGIVLGSEEMQRWEFSPTPGSWSQEGFHR